MERRLSRLIVDNWHEYFARVVFGTLSIETLVVPKLNQNQRMPATDIAWREFDLITDSFMDSEGVQRRIIFELKVKACGYRTIAQMIFYKNILLPKHFDSNTIYSFVGIVEPPNSKRSTSGSNMETDAIAFCSLLDDKYWPDNDIKIITHSELGIKINDDRSDWYISKI